MRFKLECNVPVCANLKKEEKEEKKTLLVFGKFEVLQNYPYDYMINSFDTLNILMSIQYTIKIGIKHF